MSSAPLHATSPADRLSALLELAQAEALHDELARLGFEQGARAALHARLRAIAENARGRPEISRGQLGLAVAIALALARSPVSGR